MIYRADAPRYMIHPVPGSPAEDLQLYHTALLWRRWHPEDKKKADTPFILPGGKDRRNLSDIPSSRARVHDPPVIRFPPVADDDKEKKGERE